MRTAVAATTVALSLLLSACGRKEEAPSVTPAVKSASTNQIDCSYAPSQSNVAAYLSGAAGGSAAALSAIGNALGLTVVTHSSGALILTGSGGYVAGTLGTAVAGPIVIGVGVLVAGVGGIVELVCAPKNHPELEATIARYYSRSKSTVAETAKAVGALAVDTKVELLKSGSEAISWADRKSTEAIEIFRRKPA